MELRDALSQISQIKTQLSRGEVFRGYQSWTVGCSGILAFVGALVQETCIPHPLQQLTAYLALWVGIACLCTTTAAFKMWTRCRKGDLPWVRHLTWQAVEHFLPCLIAGVIVTLVIRQRAVEVAWMLPGLWALLFSLGIFASGRLLPRAVMLAGGYYLLCAIVCLSAGSGENALWPWSMGITFGGGQLLTACILYFTLERTDCE